MTGKEGDDGNTIDHLKWIIEMWESGLINLGEADGLVSDRFVRPLLEALREGKQHYLRLGSCCCSCHPDRVTQLELIDRGCTVIVKPKPVPTCEKCFTYHPNGTCLDS